MSPTASGETIVLFDGVCNLCAGVVKFLVPKDPTGRLRFASLQSLAGQHLLTSFNVSPTDDSVVAIVDGHAYIRSDAAMAIARAVGGQYRLAAAVARLIPRPIRDIVYRYVASHRYRWFGQKDECWLPTPALRARFLLDG
jgi:predicted DCC family thiol-disulfide oxidoreductase YuxK